MPPKAAANKAQSVITGAKIATIMIGPTENPIFAQVNLNCPLDIVIDYTKRVLTQGIEQRLKEIATKLSEELPPEDNVTPLSSSDKDKLLDMEAKISKIREVLQSVSVDKIELMETTGASLNCQQVNIYFLA